MRVFEKQSSIVRAKMDLEQLIAGRERVAVRLETQYQLKGFPILIAMLRESLADYDDRIKTKTATITKEARQRAQVDSVKMASRVQKAADAG